MMCLLLLFLATFGGWCEGCETGVAFVGQSLSLYGSSLANADVALLKSYDATDVNACMNDCCTEKYGACTVASFKKNATSGGENCRLFNCRPVQKCKFVPSASTDSFSFSSQPPILVPSTSTSTSTTPRQHASSENNNSSSHTTTTTTSTTSTAVALRDDNATVVPRKGVVEEEIFSNDGGSSKPRKGVDEAKSSSKVKPRKGVGPQPSTTQLSSSSSAAVTPASPKDRLVADDLVSALEKVFEDEAAQQPVAPSVVDHHSETTTIRPSSVDPRDVIPTSTVVLVRESLQPSSSSSSLDSTMTTTGLLLPSLPVATSRAVAQTTTTPSLQTTASPGPVRTTPGVVRTTPTPSSPTILEHSRLIFHEGPGSPGETESERKYKSSMHLVLSLVVGLLILVSVLGVVAKRVYDGWMRRHYRRMDFLIDGMYNGYG